MDPCGFHTITLGCKLNRFDSAAIEGELLRRGYRSTSDPATATVVVINTCTVTHKADAEARRLIRSVRRKNPGCRLLVTGCYAELEAQTIRKIDGVDRVFGNREKPGVGAILDDLGIRSDEPAVAGPPSAPAGSIETARRTRGDRGCDATETFPPSLHFGERSRAFLRVQDGCRLACSYCVIPQARGPSRSVPPDVVVRAARSLFREGFREIVLTGVNTGDYGVDLSPSLDLVGLLRRLLAECGPNRIRLNSLEPLTVTDELIELMAGDPRIAPHVQIPLQSGSESILRLMRRNYRLERYRERVERVHAAVAGVALGADLIVGFPGESDARFRETFDFVADSPLSYLHVFAWSPRPGTPAAELPDRVPPTVVRERSASLRRLGARLSLRFRKRFEGRRLDAVVLGTGRSGRTRALTGNFIEVELRGVAARRDLIGVRVVRVTPDGTVAEPAEPPRWSLAQDAAATTDQPGQARAR